jgi:tRNA(Arg) A34 adenosine deaminase TadA
MIDPRQLMQVAIEKCREGIVAGQAPFGCAIAQDDRVLAVAHNQVLAATDITAHAEITALRLACRVAGSILLDGAMVATTCEPCPMCMAALHWARVDTVYFGASIDDAAEAGFSELKLGADRLLRLGGSHVKLVPGLLAAECRALFDQWRAQPEAQAY